MRRGPLGTKAALAAAAMLLAATGGAVAQEGIGAGEFRVYPALEISEAYESNIYLSPEDEEGDFITTVRPSLKVRLPMERHFLQAEGEAVFVLYADNDDQSHEDYRLSAAVGGDYPGGLGFTLGDTYNRRYLPVTAEFVIDEYVDVNQVYGKIAYRSSADFRLEMEYFNYLYAYEETDDLDRVENTLAAAVFFRFMPRTSALLEAGLSDLSYRGDSWKYKDNRAIQARAGISWEATGKSTGELRLGFQRKDFEEEGLRDRDLMVAAGKLTTVFSAYDVLEAELLRGTVESDYVNNPYYVTTRLTAELRHKLTYKMTGRAGAYVRRDEYPQASVEEGRMGERRDTWAGATVGLDFQMFRRLLVKAGYVLESRDSNFPRFEYTDHRITLGVKAAF